MKMMKLTIQMRGLIRRDEETGVFVSFCPALQLYSQGESEPDAEKALESAIHLFVSTCFEKGILERMLKRCGFAQADGSTSETDEFVAIEQAAYDRAFDFNGSVDPIHKYWIRENDKVGGKMNKVQDGGNEGFKQTTEKFLHDSGSTILPGFKND